MNLQKIYNLMELPKENNKLVNKTNLSNKQINLKKPDKKLTKAVQDFESYFIYSLLKEMRKTVPKNDLFSGGREEEFFTDLLDEEIGKALAARGGLGLAEILYNQFGGNSEKL